MNEPESLVHAIIGCGRAALSHVDAFKRLPGVRLKFACASHRDKAQKFATQHEIERSTTSVEEVLTDSEVSTVSIATPHFLHCSMAMRALEYGKHVLLEKPLVIDSGEAARLMEAASRSPKTVLLPVSQHRFDPVVRHLAELILGGILGEMTLCRAHLECFRPVEYYSRSNWRGRQQKEGGSVLINQAYHILDLLLWLVGPVHSVTAHMATKIYRQVIETEETLSASFEFTNGALGGLTVCGAAGSRWNSYIEIIGTTGLVAFDVGYPNAVHRLQLSDRKMLLRTKKALHEMTRNQEAAPIPIDYYGTSHRGQAEAFVNLVRTGKGDRLMADLPHAAEVVRTLELIYKSARDRTRLFR